MNFHYRSTISIALSIYLSEYIYFEQKKTHVKVVKIVTELRHMPLVTHNKIETLSQCASYTFIGLSNTL